MRRDYPWFLLAPGFAIGCAIWALIWHGLGPAVFFAPLALAYLGIWCFANWIAHGKPVPPEVR